MSDDFYPFVDSGDPAPDNAHLNGIHEDAPAETPKEGGNQAPIAAYATRIAVYDDMISTPRVIVIEPKDVRTYLEETTNTVYRCMKEQGGSISLMVIREIVENFIHAHFAEPIISILDGGNTIRFADQGPGIEDKERAFDFGVTSANRSMKRYIRGTGAGFPMVQQYLEAAGGAVSIEDNMGCGTVVTVSLDPARVREIERNGGRGAAVRPETEPEQGMRMAPASYQQAPSMQQNSWQAPYSQQGMAQNPNGAQGIPQQAMGQVAPMQHMQSQQPMGQAGYAQSAAVQPPMAPMPEQMQNPAGEIQAAVQEQPPAALADAAPQQMGEADWQGGAPLPQTAQQTYQQPAYMQQGMAPQQAAYAQQGMWQQQAYPQQQGAYAQMPWQAYAQQPLPQQPYGYAAPAVVNPYQPWQQSFQQPAQLYASSQQPAAQMMYPSQANQNNQAAVAGVYVTERGERALAYLAQNRQCGPTELARTFGSSAPTWSRELDSLVNTGLVVKQGQKFHLTALGQARMAQQ